MSKMYFLSYLYLKKGYKNTPRTVPNIITLSYLFVINIFFAKFANRKYPLIFFIFGIVSSNWLL